MLIKNNIIAFKKILIDINNKIVFIISYKIAIIINAKQKDQFIKKKMMSTNIFNISLWTKLLVNIKYFALPQN